MPHGDPLCSPLLAWQDTARWPTARVWKDEPLRAGGRAAFCAAVQAELQLSRRPGTAVDERTAARLAAALGEQEPLAALEARGVPVGTLFPRLQEALSQLSQQPESAGSALLGYFRNMSHLNSLVVTAHTLQATVAEPSSHKFAAHILALLHQCVNAVRAEARPLRPRVEQQFEMVKAYIDSCGPIELTPEHAEMLRQLAEDVVGTVASWPPGIAARMEPVLHALRAASSASGAAGPSYEGANPQPTVMVPPMLSPPCSRDGSLLAVADLRDSSCGTPAGARRQPSREAPQAAGRHHAHES